MPESRGRFLIAVWGAGLASAAAWLPWTMLVRARLEAHGEPPIGPAFWAAVVFGLAMAAAAGVAVGWRSRRGVILGAVAGALVAGLGWALGAFPGLAVEGQWAIWAAVPERQYGRQVVATAMADAIPRTALYTVGSSWIAVFSGALLGGLGALRRPAPEVDDPAPPFFAAQAIGAIAVLSAFLTFTLSAQMLPALEESAIEPLFEVDRFTLLAHALLAAFSGALIGSSALWIWRRASPRWKIGAGAVGSVGVLLVAAPWITTWIASDYAWLRQFYVYAAGAPVGLALGALIGKKGGSRRPPTRADWFHEAVLFATLLPWLLLGPCGLGAGLALSRGVAPLLPFLMDAQGEPDPSGFVTPLMFTGPGLVLWSAAGAIAVAVVLGGPMYLGLREPGARRDKLAA